jgi:N-acetyl-alpha-D-muramate 1-phosphate uridylyltransferase
VQLKRTPIAVLAGGFATRLWPLTETVPKSLVEVGGEPFVVHQLRLLQQAGFERVVLCVGHLAEQIQDFCGDGRRFRLHVDYSFDQAAPLGTAGAIKHALPLLGQKFFVIYGDSYLPCDYSAVERAFLDSGKPALMTVHRNGGKWDASNVEFAEGRIIAYDKLARTERMCHIDYGLGVFHCEAFDRIPTGESYDLARLYQALLAESRLAAFEVPERFYEIGSIQGVQEFTEWIGTL